MIYRDVALLARTTEWMKRFTRERSGEETEEVEKRVYYRLRLHYGGNISLAVVVRPGFF